MNVDKHLLPRHTMAEPQHYMVSDGELVLTLEPADEGGFVVTSPLDPELVTQAETIAEAFANARDAAQALKESCRKLVHQFSAANA